MAYDRDGDEKSPAENAKRTAMAVSQAAIASKKQPLGVSLAEGPAGDHPPVPEPHLGRGGVAVPKPEGK